MPGHTFGVIFNPNLHVKKKLLPQSSVSGYAETQRERDRERERPFGWTVGQQQLQLVFDILNEV